MSSKNVEPSEITANSNALTAEGIKFAVFGESRAAPVILTPNNLSAHPAGTHVLISGRCEPNTKRVEVFDAGNSLGDAVVIGSRWFFYRVWGVSDLSSNYNGHWLGWRGHSAGAMVLFAEQTLDNGNSDKSAVRLLTVGAMKNSESPVITSARVHSVGHLEDGRIYAVILLAGNCDKGAKINITTNGLWVEDWPAEHDGVWFAHCFLYDKIGVVAFEAKQTVEGFLRSQPSNTVSLDVPPPPFKHEEQENSSTKNPMNDVLTPTRKPPAPTLDNPLGDGPGCPQEYILYSGTCEENAIIEVNLRGTAGWVSEARTLGKKWYARARPSLEYLGKQETINVRQRVGGVYSEYSNSAIFGAELAAPLIVFPKIMTSHSADDFYLSGICNKDATIEVLNATNGQLLGSALVKGTTWVFPYQWSKGSQHVIARETWNGSRESEQVQFTIE